MTNINVRDGDGRAAWRPQDHKRDNNKFIILFPPVVTSWTKEREMLPKVQKSRKERGRNSPIMVRTERCGKDG